MTDRLVNELIDTHARQLNYPVDAAGKRKWRVSSEFEVVGVNTAILGGVVNNSLRGTIGSAAGTAITAANIAASSIIVVDNLSITVQADAIDNVQLFYNFFKDFKFYRSITGRSDAANLADVLAQPSNFKITSVFQNGTTIWIYNYELMSPCVFSISNQSQINLYAPDYTTDWKAFCAWGKALIINSY